MKKYIFISILSLIVFSCNKDEIIEGDTDNNLPGLESPSLLYRVIEYIPAPGQYINDNATGFGAIFSLEEANSQAQKRLENNQYVSLGAWGGYIIVKFKIPVNNTGDYDFAISSNAFDTSNEPGIVWVMEDKNGNGLADDTWYELKGSHFGKEGYERNYWVTYFRPEAKGNTRWEDSNGKTGYINWTGNYHSQEYYYPNWVSEDSYTLNGSRLPQQTFRDPESGEWTNYPFDWGYADNLGIDFLDNGFMNRFKISDAIDENNNSVNLSSIDFVKVQTAINGSAGWLGENSTEISGFFILE